MSTATTTARRGRRVATKPPEPATAQRRNWFGGAMAWVWLAIVIIPVYWAVITSFKAQSSYFDTNPMLPSTSPTLENYQQVFDSDFATYFLNSTIVTIGTIIPAVIISFMAAFAIVRTGAYSRTLRVLNGMFLMGLAIPLQATVIPLYLLVVKMKLYDSLPAIILPSIAFSIPLSVLVLSNFIRDVPKELFESMRMDGANDWRQLWNLAFPLTRPALVTVTIYNGLLTWNAFLLPFILTQSPDKRVLTVGLQSIATGQYGVNVPFLMAAVVLTAVPILILYAVGRRQLLSGLTAGFSK